MHKPSRAIKKLTARVVGEADYMSGVKKNLEVAKEMEAFFESKAGAVMYSAMEDLERSAFNGMASTSPWRIFKQMEYRKELGIVRYIKAKMDSCVANGEALEKNLELQYGEANAAEA